MNAHNEPSHLVRADQPDGLVFDVSELRERCMGNIAVAELILSKFAQQLQADVPVIERLFESRDVAGVARIAHSLKGAAGAVAAGRLHAIAAGVEQMARELNIDAVARDLESLRAEVERCLQGVPAARRLLAASAGRRESEGGSKP